MPDQTRYIPAGAVTIGVEYRSLGGDGSELSGNYREAYADNPSLLERIDAVAAASRAAGEAGAAPGLPDAGVSLHVFDAETGDEFLRFDCFDEEPHYHYISPERPNAQVVNCVVAIDEDSGGTGLAVVGGPIRTRVRSMLDRAGAPELATRVDPDVLERALEEATAVARDATRAQALGTAAKSTG